MTLSPKQEQEQAQALRSASRKAVQAHLKNLKQFWQRGSWIQKKNLYKHDCIKTLKNFDDNNRDHHTHLSAYIAASSLTHLADGWGYLGRALSALLNGDEGVAVHLGYYAELRAAMSLLASEGVGVFDNRHFVIDSYRQVKEVTNNRNGPRTHKFTREALEYLFKQRGTKLIDGVIKPGGHSVSDWIKGVRQTPGPSKELIEDWLRSWVLDLSRLAEDQNYRNFYSYRPTAFIDNHSVNTERTVQFITQLWRLCEPRNHTQFSLLDAHLIRSGLHRTNNTEKQNVELLLDNLSLQKDSIVGNWLDFLCKGNARDDHDIIHYARGSASPGDADHVFQVLSRALLLLRIATGSCHDHLKETGNGSNFDLLSFWWQPLGFARAVLPSDNYEDKIIDLWSDVEEAIDSIPKCDAGLMIEPYNLFKKAAYPLYALTTTERICLWGIGL